MSGESGDRRNGTASRKEPTPCDVRDTQDHQDTGEHNPDADDRTIRMS
jgi:hypothetical protein